VTAQRVSSILEDMDGVKKVDADYFSHLTRVTFDEKKASVEEMMDELGKQGFHVQGKPTYID
jgi:copper chaperone CopZ